MATKNANDVCRCVIFRFDDIRNEYLEDVQIALMNYFISKNESLSLGIIMNELDNNTQLLQKINEGYEKGLFDLALHGWNHVDYTKLTDNEQRLSLVKANQKMNDLFGKNSTIFIPPFNLFNNVTTSLMPDLGLNVLSSAIYYDEPDRLIVMNDNSYPLNHAIFHMPEMTDFSIYYNGTWVKAPIKFILGDIDFDINTYGYSIVMIHPHNFATLVNGSLSDIVDIHQLNSLDTIIGALKLKNIKIVTFSDVVTLK